MRKKESKREKPSIRALQYLLFFFLCFKTVEGIQICLNVLNRIIDQLEDSLFFYECAYAKTIMADCLLILGKEKKKKTKEEIELIEKHLRER